MLTKNVSFLNTLLQNFDLVGIDDVLFCGLFLDGLSNKSNMSMFPPTSKLALTVFFIHLTRDYFLHSLYIQLNNSHKKTSLLSFKYIFMFSQYFIYYFNVPIAANRYFSIF